MISAWSYGNVTRKKGHHCKITAGLEQDHVNALIALNTDMHLYWRASQKWNTKNVAGQQKTAQYLKNNL